MAKRFNFTYELSFDEKVNWTDITGFIDSRQTQIDKPAMSGEFKSSVGTCSFQVSYKKGIGDQMERHAALFASLVEAKMSNSRVWFHLLRNNNAIFTGTVDLSGLSQDVSNRPEWIQLTAYNNIRLLDENMKTAFEFCPDPFLYRDKDGNEVVYHSDDGKWYYKNSTIEYKGTRYPMFKLDTLWPVFKCDASDVSDDIVVQILLSQGWELSDINFAASEPILTSDGQSLRRSFAPYDPGKSERTARNYLDSLLHDNLAYMTTDGDGKFVIKRYKMTESKLSNIKGIARYLKNSRKLNIGGAIWNKDGIKLTWASLSAMKAKVYDASFSASISYGTDADGNETDELVQGGYDMPGHTYWPETGDLEEVWFDFSSDWLDRQYLCHITSKRNEDMMLMSTKNLDIDAQREPDIVLAELDGGASDNPTIMPLRMRTLFYNNSSAAKKFTRYKVYADCLYRAKVNTMVCPEMSEDYDEYTSEFIFSEENASEYARGMYNLRHYGSMVYKWVQKEEVNPGDIWVVSPRDTNISTKVFVTNVTITFENGETWYTVDALGVSAYNSEPLAKKSISVGATEASKGDKGDSSIWKHGTALWGESTARGAAGNVDDYYLNDETMNLYRCITSGNSSTAVWQYVGCIKGDDATFDGTTFTIEYALSSSDESVVFDGVFGNSSGVYGKSGSVYGFLNNIWAETVQNWYRGLYVWQRIKTSRIVGYDEDDNPIYEITYSDPVYCKDLTESMIASCVFQLVPTNDSFIVNHAKSGNGTYTAKLKFTGYPASLASSPISAVSVTDTAGVVIATVGVSYSGDTVTVTIPYKFNYEQINITVTGRYEETSTCSMVADDQTKYDVYGGTFATDVAADLWFEANCGGVMEGYSYVNTTSNTIRYFDGSQWNTLSLANRKAGIVLSQAEKDFWTLYDNTTEEEKETLWDMYGYKKEIIASAIAAQKIIMYGPGVICSSGIDPDPTEDIDSDGFLVSRGYRLEGANGIIRSEGSTFNNAKVKNLQVFDILNLQNADGTAKAQIVHPALSTCEGTKGDPTGVSVNAASGWTIADVYNGSIYQDDTFYGAGTGTARSLFNGRTLTKVFKNTNGDRRIETLPAGENGTYTYNNLCQGWFYLFGYYETNNVVEGEVGYIDIYKNGTLQRTITVNGDFPAFEGRPYSIDSFQVSDGDYVSVVQRGTWAHARTLGNTWMAAHNTHSIINANGFWVQDYTDNSWTNVGTDEIYASTVGLSLFDTWGTPLWDSDENLKYTHPTNLTGYTSYTDEDSVVHSIAPNVVYRVTGTLSYEGQLVYPAYFKRTSSTTATLILTNGVSLSLSNSAWIYLAGQIAIADIEEGVEMMGQYPKEDLAYDCGTPEKRWLTGYISNLPLTSKRSEKKDIVPLERSALEIISGVDVVRFKFIKDKRNTPLIGFIADDTDEDLAGPNHDSMMVNNCIGVLIKAVQELSAEIERLKGGNA